MSIRKFLEARVDVLTHRLEGAQAYAEWCAKHTVDCPGCGGGGGRTPVPVSVDSTTTPGQLHYVCSNCHHRWPVSRRRSVFPVWE
jgi:transposase-like protein